MQEEYKTLFDACAFTSDTLESVLVSFTALGVECLNDLQFVESRDLIKAGVKVVPARKLIHNYKEIASKPSSARKLKNSLTGIQVVVEEDTSQSKPRSRSRTRTVS